MHGLVSLFLYVPILILALRDVVGVFDPTKSIVSVTWAIVWLFTPLNVDDLSRGVMSFDDVLLRLTGICALIVFFYFQFATTDFTPNVFS